jgi:hypothetical protein
VIRESVRPGLTTNTAGAGRSLTTLGGIPRVPTELASQKNERKPVSGDLGVIGPQRRQGVFEGGER